METQQQTTAPQPDEALRLARIIQAGAVALGAYEKYVKALADSAAVDVVREAYEGFRIADGSVMGLRARRGYEYGDRVRLNAPGPWHNLTGTLEEGLLDRPEYRFRIVFDKPQPSENQPDGFSRDCVTDIDSIADIEP